MVTALFDINRDITDGRTIHDYLDWLKNTISIFPDTLIFHDGICDGKEFASGIFVRIDRNDLWMFKEKDSIAKVIDCFEPVAKGDITFKNPLYSIVQFSKFELLKIAKDNYEAESYMWIDAGISRFIDPALSNALHLQENSQILLNGGINYAFEIDLKNNLKPFHLSIQPSKPGTCRRVVSGTSFWIQGDSIIFIWDIIKVEIRKWINNKCWDNEQVMLRKILPDIPNIEFIIQWKSPTGSVARMMNSKKIKPKKVKNWFIRKLMSRG
jgi:hypothetical protein